MQHIVVVGGRKRGSNQIITMDSGDVITFHDFTSKCLNRRQEVRHVVNSADCVVVLTNCCSHQGMWAFRDLCRQLNKPIFYHTGTGLSGIMRRVQLRG